MERGVWWTTVHGIAKSQTQLSDFHFHSSFRSGYINGSVVRLDKNKYPNKGQGLN